jgi:type I restriction-modification system DNA methylase subunit
MPDIQKIKLDFQSLFGKSKKNHEMPEEELRTLFTKSDILENLGYGTIGKDIRLELFIKGKKSDIACIDDYGNVVFVLEFKKPSDSVDIKDHFDQLWDRYVKPLRADFGALINGYELILYRRIGENNNLELRVNLSEITDKDCELIYKLLKKPDYSLTQVKDILNYLNKFSAPESRVYLTTDAAREHFFENFKLEVDSIFGELLKNTIKLFDYEYSRSKFLTSAYDFWRKSYAKKPDKVPESWKKLLKGAGLSTGEEDLYKFMFCLETTYALFTRLILAKACEDYNFQGIDFSEFIESEIKGSERRGGTFLVMWGVLVMRLIRKMRRDLVESVFEEDLFYWWTDDFEGLQNNIYADQRSYEEALMDFSRALAKVLYALYKFDFSKIIGDPLGDLYQKYFDRETRKALGEFYTPKEVVEYIVDAVDYRGRGIVDKRLLDPACGSGTFLVDALKRYLVEAAPLAEEKGWDFVLSKLCNEYHIVGFDIHPFATIMAQIQFMLVLIPKYKEALKKNPNFVLKRLPIFRTDSLIDESKSEAMTLSMFEGGRSVEINITLPVRAGDKFMDAKVIMPYKKEAISEKTGLLNNEEYFAALQALFDTVKEAARAEPEKQVIEKERLESSFKLYLPRKDWAKLASFFIPYGRYFLDTIKKLRSEYGDGRLVKSIEDIILAGLLKNHVEYDFVVGNPPYVRTARFGKEENELFRKNYWTPYGSFDIYLPFMERGIRWLKQDGKFGYITSNKYVITDYGIKLRSFILNNCEIQQILDMSLCPDIFEEPQIYAAISIFKRKTSEIIQNTKVVNPQTNKMAMGIVLKNDPAILKEILNEINKEKVIRTDFTIQKSLQERFAKNQENLFDIYAVGFDDIVNEPPHPKGWGILSRS